MDVEVGWLFEDRAPAEAHALALAWMTAAERAKHDRYVFEHSRAQDRLSRWLVRSQLSKRTGVAPADFRFRANEHGRPEIDSPAEFRGVRFNLSHTHGLVALAIADGREVGVDVEDVSKARGTDAIAERFFAPAEVAAFRAIEPAEARRERFFAYWTLKEAYLKARGFGLALPLDGFAFELGGGAIRITFDPRIPDDPRRWRFLRREPSPTHRLALAIERLAGDEPRVTCGPFVD